MLFSSAVFLFLFLPLVVVLYYLAPQHFRNVVLLLASILFYTWGEKKFVVIMLFSTVVDYLCGLMIAKGHRRVGLGLSMFVNLGLLVSFKYANFFVENINTSLTLLHSDYTLLKSIPQIVLPLGISFYTFQTMSYTIDVYRGSIKANKNFIEFATYVTMFPQLVAGPIVRYIDIQSQLRNKQISVNNFAVGLERFILGLVKKLLIANTCATVADDVFSMSVSDLSTPWAWMGILAYSFQIYYDFSGYSDMAIGLGKIFGFNFPENFNYPYIARSIREFWRRWHISLSTWFRDYLYIPLGGSKKSAPRTYLNLFIVFLVTGLWHGASWNFIVWGVYHGIFMLLERIGFGKILDKLPGFVQHLYTLLIVVCGWVFFRADNLSHAVAYLGKMFSFSPGEEAVNSYFTLFYVNKEVLGMGMMALVFAVPVYQRCERILHKMSSVNTLAKQYLAIANIVFLVVLSCVLAAYVAAGTYNPFIYFRF